MVVDNPVLRTSFSQLQARRLIHANLLRDSAHEVELVQTSLRCMFEAGDGLRESIIESFDWRYRTKIEVILADTLILMRLKSEDQCKLLIRRIEAKLLGN